MNTLNFMAASFHVVVYLYVVGEQSVEKVVITYLQTKYHPGCDRLRGP